MAHGLAVLAVHFQGPHTRRELGTPAKVAEGVVLVRVAGDDVGSRRPDADQDAMFLGRVLPSAPARMRPYAASGQRDGCRAPTLRLRTEFRSHGLTARDAPAAGSTLCSEPESARARLPVCRLNASTQ